MSKKVFRIWCEWDIGNEHVVFTTEAKAREWARNNESLQEVFDRDLPDLEAVEEEGLIGYRDLELDPT